MSVHVLLDPHICALYTHINKTKASVHADHTEVPTDLPWCQGQQLVPRTNKRNMVWDTLLQCTYLGSIGVCLLLVLENRIISEILSQVNVLAHSERKCLCVTTRFSLFLLHLLVSGKTFDFIACKRADSD